jgi:hypothetical protein
MGIVRRAAIGPDHTAVTLKATRIPQHWEARALVSSSPLGVSFHLPKPILHKNSDSERSQGPTGSHRGSHPAVLLRLTGRYTS